MSNFVLKEKEIQVENRWALQYNRLHLKTYFERMMYRDLVRAVGKMTTGEVLECGCGTGIVLRQINARVKYGVDFSIEMLRNLPSTIVRVCADIDYLPFRSECFKTIFLSGVLHHKEHTSSTLMEMARILCNGGEILIQEPTAAAHLDRSLPVKSLIRFFLLLRWKLIKTPNEYSFLPSPPIHKVLEMKEFLKIARETGFHVQETRYLYSASYALSTFEGKLPVLLGRLVERILPLKNNGYLLRSRLKWDKSKAFDSLNTP